MASPWLESWDLILKVTYLKLSIDGLFANDNIGCMWVNSGNIYLKYMSNEDFFHGNVF